MDNLITILLIYQMGNLCDPHLNSSTLDEKEIQLQKPTQNQNQQVLLLNPSPQNQFQKTSNFNESNYQPKILEQQIIKLPDGSQYHGYTKNNIPHGLGVQCHENGDKYKGPFVEGLKSGIGRYEYANRIVYVGHFYNGQIEGIGRLDWPNGDSYEGQFKNNKMNGSGKYYCKANDSYFDGNYLDGKKHGKGTIRMNKQVITGYWDMGQFKYKKFIAFQPI